MKRITAPGRPVSDADAKPEVKDKEKEARTVAPRKADGTQLDPMAPEAFIELVKQECGSQWGL